MRNPQKNSWLKHPLTGKTVVITGASSGVGMATALAFARVKAHLVLAARREKALQEVAAECEALGAIAIVVPTDVSDPEAVKALAFAAIERFRRIDVWINNAGVLAAGLFDDTPVEVHDQVIRVNLMGYLHGAHAVLPYFKKQQHGVLVNNISVGGWIATPYGVGYSASKFGLKGFSQALRAELNPWPGIHVCDIFPAFLDTPGIQHAANYTGHDVRPAPPVYDPQKVARAIVRLAANPRPSLTIGAAAYFLEFAHALFPGLTGIIAQKMIAGYLEQAPSTLPTNGNLFEPVEFGTSIHGGWSKPADPRKQKIRAGILVAALAAGWWLARRSARRASVK